MAITFPQMEHICAEYGFRLLMGKDLHTGSQAPRSVLAPRTVRILDFTVTSPSALFSLSTLHGNIFVFIDTKSESPDMFRQTMKRVFNHWWERKEQRLGATARPTFGLIESDHPMKSTALLKSAHPERGWWRL